EPVHEALRHQHRPSADHASRGALMSHAPTPLTAEQTAALLPYGALADEIAAVLRANAAGTLSVPERTVVDLPTGTLLSMPASDADLAIVKVVTVHPGNAGSELPTITGE